MPKAETIAAKTRSWNVFADLGVAYAERTLLKSALTLRIYRTIERRRLTQRSLRKILEVDGPGAAALMRNRPGRLPLERLLEFATKLGHDVEVTVRPTATARGNISVVLLPQTSRQRRAPRRGSRGQ